MEVSALRSCPKESERSKAVRDRSVSLRYWKSLVLGFLVAVLTRRSLLCAAILEMLTVRQPTHN
ncbi:hypothetical protein HMPREF9104_03168 [Lentilactobacillus kisonensis F0435]|uniref:Uncharacterized protein n=1 Tax=Lentilactobacillus kisonensis F0435 TaxID=797516 RepID=H1LKL4_9LACO|nr:hypothetical protein HMPREF9104_03168 [Lentilactobacillus kisonensis F0435]